MPALETLIFWRCCAKRLKRKELKGSLYEKRNQSQGTHGMQHRKVFPVDMPGGAQAAQCQTLVDPPEPAEELECRRREGGHCLCSVMKKEGHRETYPLSATSWWGGYRLSSKVHREEEEHQPVQQHGIYSLIQGRKLFIFREVKYWSRSPESLLDFHPWRCSKESCAWPWATWSDGTQVGQHNGHGDLCKSSPTYTILWSHLATSVSVVPKSSVSFSHPLLSSKWSRHGRQSNK